VPDWWDISPISEEYRDCRHETPHALGHIDGIVVWAAKPEPPQDCVITYSIVEKDALGNVNQGAPEKNLKWLHAGGLNNPLQNTP
jgi:hypothetical protein